MKGNLNRRTKKIIILAVCLVVSIAVSCLAFYPETFKVIVKNLEEKRNVAMAIAATASGVSLGMSLLPDDFASPLATEISKVSSYVLLAVCVLLLEKYMMTIFWFVAFALMIPLACVLKTVSLFNNSKTTRSYSGKFVAFALAIICIVPLSVGISAVIEKTQDISMEYAMQQVEDIESDLEEDSSFWEKVKTGVSGTTEKLKVKMNCFIDSIAVMIVTICGIPLLVFIFVFWMIKTLFALDISVPKIKPKRINKKEKRQQEDNPLLTQENDAVKTP